jgi:hypothetical protein
VLDLNPETVQQIIDRAHEYQTQDSFNLSDDDEVVPLEDFEEEIGLEIEDPIYQELKNAIDDLEPDQQVSLVALMWLGRGDYTLDEWQRALHRAGESWNTRTADYLIRTPLLADYLSDGLEQLRDEMDEK